MSLTPRGSAKATLRGIALIARGRPEGLNCFGDSNRSILASLTPGLGLSAGTLVTGLFEGDGAAAFSDLFVLLSLLLGPVVISHELARLWGREAFWGRYIVAFNWCLLVIPLIVLLAGLLVMPLSGASPGRFLLGLNLVLGLYALWLSWFIARHALALGFGRAIAFVTGVHFGTLLLLIVPLLLAGHGPVAGR